MASMRIAGTLERVFLEKSCLSHAKEGIGGLRSSVDLQKSCPFPIDAVYTWVNGSDPLWLAEKAKWLEKELGIKEDGEEEGVGGENEGVEGGEGGEEGGEEEEGEEGGGDDVASSNRFRDSGELRYSLRSLEKYAPWLRRIYLVTNGQVPRWLDVSHPRVQVVSHSDIFPNASDLPVFSSPAIEAHLHRIPGVSQRFIYFNDDVFLGAPVWPADFWSAARGTTVYLDWEVPKCAPGCLDTWIGDGFCDNACNNAPCMFDGPDCVEKNREAAQGGGDAGGGGGDGKHGVWEEDRAEGECEKGCPVGWIGDGSCDVKCEAETCAFDGGDCGMEKVFNYLPGTLPTLPTQPSTIHIFPFSSHLAHLWINKIQDEKKGGDKASSEEGGDESEEKKVKEMVWEEVKSLQGGGEWGEEGEGEEEEEEEELGVMDEDAESPSATNSLPFPFTQSPSSSSSPPQTLTAPVLLPSPYPHGVYVNLSQVMKSVGREGVTTVAVRFAIATAAEEVERAFGQALRDDLRRKRGKGGGGDRGESPSSPPTTPPSTSSSPSSSSSSSSSSQESMSRERDGIRDERWLRDELVGAVAMAWGGDADVEVVRKRCEELVDEVEVVVEEAGVGSAPFVRNAVVANYANAAVLLLDPSPQRLPPPHIAQKRHTVAALAKLSTFQFSKSSQAGERLEQLQHNIQLAKRSRGKKEGEEEGGEEGGEEEEEGREGELGGEEGEVEEKGSDEGVVVDNDDDIVGAGIYESRWRSNLPNPPSPTPKPSSRPLDDILGVYGEEDFDDVDGGGMGRRRLEGKKKGKREKRKARSWMNWGLEVFGRNVFNSGNSIASKPSSSPIPSSTPTSTPSPTTTPSLTPTPLPSIPSSLFAEPEPGLEVEVGKVDLFLRFKVKFPDTLPEGGSTKFDDWIKGNEVVVEKVVEVILHSIIQPTPTPTPTPSMTPSASPSPSSTPSPSLSSSPSPALVENEDVVEEEEKVGEEEKKVEGEVSERGQRRLLFPSSGGVYGEARKAAYRSLQAANGKEEVVRGMVEEVWRVLKAGAEVEEEVFHDGRRRLDTYGDSLVFTNRLVSEAFGRRQRKVPAHMPHMVDREVMKSLQSRPAFAEAFAETSKHRFRSSRDVQFAFAYFYFIMEGGAAPALDMAKYFREELDTDGDGVLSRNEIRTLAAVIEGGAPSEEKIAEITRCISPTFRNKTSTTAPDGTKILTIEQRVPPPTLQRILACPEVRKGLQEKARRPNTHNEGPIEEVAFEMITDDFNKTREQLDSIRGRKAKFVCVNDDMKKAPPRLQRLLENFYLSFFPKPSQFELPPSQEHDILYIKPLQEHLQTVFLIRLAAIFTTLLLAAYTLSAILRSSSQTGTPKKAE